MASGLQRDAIVILRIDGEDLLDFINGPSYEAEMISIFSQIDMSNELSISGNISKALQLLSVDHGMPPLSDTWVMSNIVEPALQAVVELDTEEMMIKQEIMLEEFKKVAEKLAQLLKAQPVIVAHNEQTFDGSDIRRLISSKFEFNKILEAAMKDLNKDENGNVPKESLSNVIDLVGPSTGLPPFGAIDQVDEMLKEAIRWKIEGESGKMIEKEELKKLVTEVLEMIILQLEENPVSVSSNSVLHDPISDSSTP